MPHKKDFVSFKTKKKRKRKYVQTKLILSNLKKTNKLFKERYPKKKDGFLKCCELRPKYCVMALCASGTHNICVCSIHQKCYTIDGAM